MPFIITGIKMYMYQLIIEYGFYFLLLVGGAGFYFWRRLKSWFTLPGLLLRAG